MKANHTQLLLLHHSQSFVLENDYPLPTLEWILPDPYMSRKRATRVWICLYTCCVVRAVHLDIVPNLTTSAFLRSFKRFTAQRGLPQKLILDNAKTFVAAAELIKATTKDEEVQGYLAGVGVEWQFNLEKAPWWGGIFERMVKSTK